MPHTQDQVTSAEVMRFFTDGFTPGLPAPASYRLSNNDLDIAARGRPRRGHPQCPCGRRRRRRTRRARGAQLRVGTPGGRLSVQIEAGLGNHQGVNWGDVYRK